MNIDQRVNELVEKNVNIAVPYYLMAAYAYYKEDDPIISDHLFDYLALLILKNYDQIKHPHKQLITKDDLEAGTYLGEYPRLVIDSLKMIRTLN
jgi:NAD-dependent DNA ligase